MYKYSLLLLLGLPLTQEMGMKKNILYNADDKLQLLDSTNFQSIVCGSEKAWFVEFYSSWCGHCINFAPIFKVFAADVYEWRDVVSVGAIDCAQDANVPTCREYEVMGYPSLKFFAPNTPTGDTGQDNEFDDLNSLTAEGVKMDMIRFVSDLQKKSPEKAGKRWPNLQFLSLQSDDLSEVWDNTSHQYAVLLVEDNANASIGLQVLMDISVAIKKLSIPLHVRLVAKSTSSLAALAKLKVASGPSLVAISRDLTLVELLEAPQYSRESWHNAVRNFIWSRSKEFAISGKEWALAAKVGAVVSPTSLKDVKTASRKELMNRRYKVFLSDLEKALFYALSHEVAQHATIAGAALAALQKFVTVVGAYFPARPAMATWLASLHAWIHGHEDAIRGEDFSAWMTSSLASYGLQENPDWLGCRGSKPQYGGYPCGLWSLWHTLTLAHAAGADRADPRTGPSDPKEVLFTMKGFIQEFFGCRDCARHFDQTIEQGRGIDENVHDHKDAVLYLWKVHNRVNIRLQGDISEDPVFPKEVFPVKEFCSRCYSLAKGGSNLWDEFNLDEVYNFLQDHYSGSRLSQQGIVQSGEVGANPLGDGAAIALRLPEAVQSHDGEFQETEELDMVNFRQESNNSATFIFFNGVDISFGLLIWIVSAALILAFYLRFVSGRRLVLLSRMKRKTSVLNPLLGKV